MPADKQAKILTAAFNEFGAHGYDRASTNAIIKQAEISKGMLFYYFNSKEELFNDLMRIALDYALDAYGDAVDGSKSDYFDRIYQIAKVKLKIQHEHPEMLRFLGVVFVSHDEERLYPAVRERFHQESAAARARLTANLDMSRFREDVPTDTIRQMITWLNEGYEKMLVAQLEADGSLWEEQNLNRLWDEYYEFLKELKKIFYKNNL